jgi:RNA polymerase sigma-70 factor (ECF subfamily)
MSDHPTRTIVLVRRAQEGDQQALERIINRYYERVRKIVRIRLGPKLRTALDSGDILQDTFIAAARRFKDFEPRDEASLINWLSKLAEHQITDAAAHYNAKKRDISRRVSLEKSQSPDEDSGPGLAADPPDDGPSPSEVAVQAEEASIVEECLHELPEQYRDLILMRNYAGSTWADIAKKTHRPSEAAARMMHARAMVELGKLMKHRRRTAG